MCCSWWPLLHVNISKAACKERKNLTSRKNKETTAEKHLYDHKLKSEIQKTRWNERFAPVVLFITFISQNLNFFRGRNNKVIYMIYCDAFLPSINTALRRRIKILYFTHSQYFGEKFTVYAKCVRRQLIVRASFHSWHKVEIIKFDYRLSHCSFWTDSWKWKMEYLTNAEAM